MLIERASWLSLQVAMMDARVAMAAMTRHDIEFYIAWTNALRRTLVAIGVGMPPSPPSLADALEAGRTP
jgi:hypothetical protein